MKNGKTRRGKQNHKCRDCGRQFVEDPQWQPKDKDIIALVNLLLLEKIPLAGIVRAVGMSASWLQNYVNKYYQNVEKKAEVVPKEKGKLTVQMDELWSFVDNKGTSNGSGLPSMLEPEKSSDVRSATARGHQPENSGIHYQGYISSAPRYTQTCGRHLKR